MPSIDANGLVVGYEAIGNGPPLVMLHGATSAGREDFAAQVPLFSKAFHLYLPDARGHATTRWDVRDGFEYGWLVDDLEALVDAWHLPTFHLLGFSMGALTALRFAARRPQRIRTLVLVGITAQREPRSSVARRLMDPERIDRHDPAWAAELSRRHDAVQGEGAWRRLLPAIVRDVAGQDLLTPRDLRAVDAPTLVVAGDRDPFVPVDQAWGLARQLSDARLFIVPDCGHEPMVRRPALFNEACAGFYRSTEAVARRRAGQLAAGTSPRAPTTAPARGTGIHSSALGEVRPEPPEPGGTDVGWIDEGPRESG
jgi:pimeloyl-ACP methyl ester carboxylesterase